MAAMVKMILAVAVLLTPGGFVLLVGYLLARALRAQWLLAQTHGTPFTWREALGAIHLKELVQQARTTF